MNALLIPITLDALMVRPGPAEPWAATQMAQPTAAGTTRQRQQLAPDPFQTLTGGRPPGAYLHWALPDALGHGVQNQAGTTTFPTLPNRWIVVRLSGPATPGGRRVDGWMLPDISTATPVTVADFLIAGPPAAAPTPAQPLTVLGHGDPSWAAYFDNVLGRLAFYDDLATAATGPVSYLVCGWYLDPAQDPLPRTTETALRAYLEQQKWQADLPAGALPTQSLFHGAAVSIGWPDPHWTGDGGRLGDEPDLRPDATGVEVAAGVTLADALAVFTASPDEVALARLMTGLLSGALDRLTSADGPARLDTVLHADRFGSVPAAAGSETIWEAPVTGGPDGKFQPVKTAAPRSWHPADPALVLRGAGRSFRHGGDGRFADTGALDCRVEGTTVTAFGVAGGNPGDGAAVLPADRLAALAARTPTACAALLVELAALDPGSAPDLAQATATQPSPVAAARAAWWATWEPGAGPLDGAVIAGTLPSPLAVTPPTRPWTPIHLEWRADYFPSRLGHHDWDLADLDYEPAPGGDVTAQPTHHLSGRILLTAAGAGVTAEIVPALADQDLLSGSLDHLSEQLRGDSTDALVQAPGAGAAPLPGTPLPADFVGLRAGALDLTALRVVDGYGRTLDLPPAVVPSTDAGFPVRPGALALPPRFTAPARMLLRYTDATGAPLDADSGRTPVCGFLVPSPVDGALEFFGADASGLGRLRPDRLTGVAWEPDPGRPANAGARPGADIANPFLSAIAESLLDADRAAALGGAGATETVLNGVQQVMDTTRWTVDLTGRTGDEHLALLLGAPVAVLRAAILLEVDDPRQPAGLAANAVEVKLGTLAHQQDGLLGYFIGDDYTRMRVVDPAVRDAVVGTFADAYLADPTFTVQPGIPVTLTLLTVPGTDVHVTAGLVPQKAVGQLREWTAPALAHLSPALRFGPVLRDPAATRLPYPSDIRGTWTWHRRPGPGAWASDTVVRATADALLPPTVPEASDGWLQVALLPDNLYRDTASRIGIDRIRTRRGPRGRRGAILAVGTGDRALLTVAEAARLQESGRFAFHVAPTGAEVHVITDASGEKSLHTSLNPSDPNGLATLPEADGVVDRLSPATATQGTAVHVVLRGTGLAGVTDVTFTDPGIEVTSLLAGETWVDVAVTVDPEVTPGPQTLTVFTEDGTADASRVTFEILAAGANVTRWTAGTRSNVWTNAGNWSAGVPTATSIVVIDTPATVSAPSTVTRLRGLIVDSTATLSISTMTVASLELRGQTSLNALTMTVTESCTWTGGRITGGLTLGPRSATRIEGPDVKQISSSQGSQFLMHGTMVWDGAAPFTLTSLNTLDGLLVVTGQASLGGTQLHNWGTIEVTAGSTLTFDGGSLDQRGTVQLSGGSMRFPSGQHQWRTGSVFAGTGSVQITAPAMIFTNDVRLTVESGVTVALASGSINGALTVEGGGTLNWTGGTISSGPFEFRPGTHIVLDSSAVKTVGGQLIVRGDLTWRAGTLQLSTSLINEGRLDVRGVVACIGNGTLVNNGTVAVAEGAALNLTSAVLDNFGTLELTNGTVDFQQGTNRWRPHSRVIGAGTVQLHSPATVFGEGRVDTTPGITIQVLTGILNGGAGFALAGGATVAWQGGTIGSGTIELAPDCPLVVDGPAARTLSATLTVRSAVTLSGGATIQLSGVLINEGRLTVQATTAITGSGTINNSGTIALAPGAGLTTSSSITHTGKIELGGGSVDLQNGVHTWGGGSRITGTGTVRVLSPANLTAGTAGGAAVVAPGVTVQLVSGTVTGPFALQGGGTLAWLGGTIAGSGFGTAVEARADCPVLVDGAAARTLSGTFIMRGTTTWTGGATVQIGGTLINHGALTLQSTAQFTGGGTVRNFGVAALDPAVALTLAGPVLDHAGTVRLAGGTLTLQTAAHIWRDGSAFDGAGVVSLASGSVGGSGRVNAAGGVDVQLAGATLSGNFALDGGGTFTWLSGTVGTGLVDVHPACAVVFDGTGAKTVSGTGLVVRGASTWRGGGTLQLSGPLINIGTLTVQATTQVTGISTFTNKGTVVLADGVTLTMAGPALDHQGNVQFTGGGLILQAGSHNWRDDAALTGTGQLTLTTVTGTPPTLTANGHLAVSAGAGLTVNAGTLTGTGTVEGGGTLTWTGGTISATLDVDPGCPVRISGTSARTLSGNLTVQGDTTWSDGGTLQLTGVLTNQGTLAVQATAQCTGTNKLVNKGTIRLAEGAGLTMAGPDLTQTGVVRLAGGTLALQGTGHHLGDGCRFTGAGTVALSGTTTMFLDSHLVIAPGVTLQITSGTVSGACTVEGGGTVVWSGGTITGNSVDFRADCPIVLNTTATKTTAGNVVLRGTTTWTDGGTITVSSGGLVNEGTLTIQTTAQCTGVGTLTNRGLLALADGVGLTMAGPALTQSSVLELSGGTVTLQSGSSRLDDGSRLTGSGTLLVAGTASLTGDTHLTTSPGITVRVSAGSLAGSAAFEGGGTFSWTGGTINNTLDVRPECAVTISGGGTRNLNGALIVRGATTWTDGGTLQQAGSGSLTNEGVLTIAADAQITGLSITNRGTIALTGGAGLALSGSSVDHSGTIDLSGGAFSLTGQQTTWREGAAVTGAGQVTVNAATTLTGTGRLTLGPGVGIVLNGGSLTGTNNTCIVEGGGTVQLIGGQIGGVEIRPDSVLVINGTAAKSLSNSILRGTTTWSEGGTLQISGNVTQEGTLTVTDDAQTTGAGALINRGTVILADGVDLAFNGPVLDHFGDLRLAGGTVDIQKTNGHNWRSGAAFTGTGTVRVQGPATVTGGGHVAAGPGVTVQHTGTLNGTLTFEGGGTFTWLGGSVAAAEFRPGCRVLLDGAAPKTLNGNVTLRGDTTWTGTGALANGGGRTLTLTGRLEIGSDVQATGFSNLINLGVVALRPGVVWTVTGPVLTSSGTLELNTGTLQLGAGAHTLVGRSEVDTILETPDEFGRIVATGSLALTGILAVDPGTTAPFTVVTAAPLTGSFTDVTSTEGDWTATYSATAATSQPVS